MNPRRLVLTLAAATLLCAAPARARSGDFVIHAGHVMTATGIEFADGGSVFVSGGRVEDVQPGYVNPWGAEVRQHKDRWLFPGFVEAHSQSGLERANERAPNTPFVSVLDGLDPLSSYFKGLLRDGVTTVLVIPGDQTMLGGQGLVLDPVGRTVEEMIVLRDAGMKVALAPRRGTSRMAQIAELRRALESARRSEGERVVRDPDAGGRDPRQEALSKMLAGRVPAVFACTEPVDVTNAYKLAEEFSLRSFLTLGPRCRRALPFIARMRLSVVLPPDIEPLEVDPETGEETRYALAREFHEAGVPVVLQANEGSAYGMRSLWYQAATAVAQGLSREDALRAITVNPARLLGVEKRVGAIAKGLDANIVLWTGDPLDPGSWVDHVYVEGELVYERAKDKRLRRLIKGATVGNEEER